MPWQRTGPMDERMSLIVSWQEDRLSMSELCRRYGVSGHTESRLRPPAPRPANGAPLSLRRSTGRPYSRNAAVRIACIKLSVLAGSDRSRLAAAERSARADAPDAEG